MASRIVGKGSAAILVWIFLGVTAASAVTVTFEIADQAEFDRIIDPSAVLTTHATINTWLEGPTWVSEGGGGYLVFRFADRISVLVSGAVLVEGSPDMIAQHPRVKEVYLGESHG